MRKGFTLLEMLTVVFIIVVLALTVVLILKPEELLREGRSCRQAGRHRA